MQFIEVARVDDIPPQKSLAVTVSSKTVLIANYEGKYYAVGNLCTHVGGDLSKGTLQGEVVTCPLHGSMFDITSGKRISGPALKDLAVYPLKIEGGVIKLGI